MVIEKRWLWLLFVVLLVAGCGREDITDLKDYVAKVKARPKGAITPMPEIKIAETFVFDPSGLRDPFEPSRDREEVADVQAGNGIRPDSGRAREELESFALDSLRLVGTVNLQAVTWGLIKVNDGAIHRVKTGNYMGLNHGKIVRVNDDRIELLEIVPDGPNNWREQQSSIALAG